MPIKNLPLLLNTAYAGYNRGLPGGDLTPKPDGTTFCNIFIQSICTTMGYDNFSGMNANQMFQKMSGTSSGWISVEDEVAQFHANAGVLVIAAWSNAAGHGHVNLIIPGLIENSNSAGKSVPKCANVGRDVFWGKRLSYAFSYPNEKPTLFALAEMV